MIFFHHTYSRIAKAAIRPSSFHHHVSISVITASFYLIPSYVRMNPTSYWDNTIQNVKPEKVDEFSFGF